MRISEGAYPQFLRALIFTRPLCKADEETLVRRKPIYRLQVFGFGCVFPRDISQNFSAQIRHVFTQCEPAVDMDVIYNYILRVLVRNTFGPFFKLLPVIFGPPFAQISMVVELAALIVKTVRQLMPDGPAGIAIVRRIIHFGIVEWWLEHASGKVDVV